MPILTPMQTNMCMHMRPLAGMNVFPGADMCTIEIMYTDMTTDMTTDMNTGMNTDMNTDTNISTETFRFSGDPPMKTPCFKSLVFPALSLCLLGVAVPALAHVGNAPHIHGSAFQAGLLHPLTGVDHLLMLLAAGMLGALVHRRLLLPAATLAAMALGALAGHALGAFSGMEMVIVAGVLLAGVAMLLPRQLNRLAWGVPLLALAHGWAHGVEADAGAVAPFMTGFLMSSVALMLAGLGLGALLQQKPRWLSLTGGSLVASAAWLFTGL